MPSSPPRGHISCFHMGHAALLVPSLALLVMTVLLVFPFPAEQAAAAPGDFRLPYAGGLRLLTLQGQNQGSHLGPYNRYAYDFATGPHDDTPFVVVAARAGKVVRVVQSNGSSQDCDLGTQSQANYVLIDHGDNVGSWYSHLLKDSVLVRLGQQVTQGQPLARSDHSGYVCGVSHLHFTVVDLRTMVGLDIPLADPSLSQVGGRPRTNGWYSSSNAPVLTGAVAAPQGKAASYRSFIPLIRTAKRR